MTIRRALIIAHGSPADPEPQERWIAALADRIADLLPDWHLRGTTLAMPGALEAAVAAMPDALVYPWFMAEGWFTRTLLPRRLTAAGMNSPRQLPAFGLDPALAGLLARTARQAALDHDLPEDATLLLAAHGSQVSRASATRTGELADDLRKLTRFRIVTGFVEEAPFLSDVARIDGPALCLPLFATRAGHVAQDVPEALAAARFTGPLLPAIGEHPEAAHLAAAAIAASA